MNAAEQTRIEYSASRLLVKATGRWRSWSPFGYGGSVDVTVELPAGSRVTGASSLGDISLHGGARRLPHKDHRRDLRRAGRSGEADDRSDLRTGYGQLDNSLNAAEPPQPGADAVEVRTRTGYGDITIRRGNPPARIDSAR